MSPTITKTRFIDVELCDYCGHEHCRCAPDEICPECGECPCECVDEDAESEDDDRPLYDRIESTYSHYGYDDAGEES